MKLNTTELQSFITGNLIGDGNIHNGAFMTIQINQDLVQFKKRVFERYMGFSQTTIKHIPYSTDRYGVARQDSWRLYVSPNRFLHKQRKLFYEDKQRTLPRDLFDKITPLGLAIWFADDGTTIQVGYNPYTQSSKKRRVQLCTDAYSLEDVEYMANVLQNRYGKTTVISRGANKGYRIQLSTMAAQKMFLDIAPYFLKYFPSLLYKLDMGYRNLSLANRRYVSEEYHNLFLKISSHEAFVDRLQAKGHNKGE